MTLAAFTSEPFTYQGGGLAVGVPVRVYYGGTLVMARLSWDSTGTLKQNPVRTADDGTVSFWCEPGSYDMLVNGTTFTVVVPSGGGVPPTVDKGVTLPFSVDAGSGAGTGKSKLYNDTGLALTLDAVRVSVDALSGAAMIVDVNMNGGTIFANQSNRPTIPAPGGTVKVTNFDVTAVPAGAFFTVDVDQAGNYTDLVVQIHMR